MCLWVTQTRIETVQPGRLPCVCVCVCVCDLGTPVWVGVQCCVCVCVPAVCMLHPIWHPMSDELAAGAKQLFATCVKQGTKENWSSMDQKWCYFCAQIGVPFVPCKTETVVMYAVWMLTSGMSPGSVKNYLGRLNAFSELFKAPLPFREVPWVRTRLWQALDQMIAALPVTEKLRITAERLNRMHARVIMSLQNGVHSD